MQFKKATYSPKSRKDISNPLHKLSHAEQLKLAGVRDISKNHQIVHLSNGKMVVRAINKV
jgi:hypothetical protein